MNETTYDRVKQLCKRKGVSVAQMERDIGVPRGNACKWKQTVPSVPALNKLSAYLDTSISYLLNGDEDAAIPAVDIKAELNRLAALLKNGANIEYDGKPLNALSKSILANNIEQSIKLCDVSQRA